MTDYVMQRLVVLLKEPNITVIDPFLGSGTTGRACRFLNVDFIGIEIDKDYAKLSDGRIKNSGRLQ